MSVQSTIDITRNSAIQRILKISSLVLAKNYFAVEEDSFEPHDNLEEFVENGLDFDISLINNFTNKMLEDILDRPFFRFSMFDNYLINDHL